MKKLTKKENTEFYKQICNILLNDYKCKLVHDNETYTQFILNLNNKIDCNISIHKINTYLFSIFTNFTDDNFETILGDNIPKTGKWNLFSSDLENIKNELKELLNFYLKLTNE